jgi:hypothetical protein
MFSELALQYNDTLYAYQPFHNKEGESELLRLSSPLKKEIIALGERYLSFTFESLSATAFMDFNRTGNRTDYEEIYFNKRRALNALVMAECVENNGRFMDPIVNGIFSICEESAWQLPAHNTYIRDTPQLLLPDFTRPILDLFACETGALLATILYLMSKHLDAVSPAITQRIRYELNNRIITPYLN